MEQYVWTEEETELLLTVIRDKNVTIILDNKQQRNSECYKDIKGFAFE